ncbi:MAG: DnaJ domain-containing protein [Candidatus Babeliales bacterium]|jgi:curved DNA-binding protein CbpA
MNKIEKNLKIFLLLTSLFICNQTLFTPEEGPEKSGEQQKREQSQKPDAQEKETAEQRDERLRNQTWRETKLSEMHKKAWVHIKDAIFGKPEKVKLDVEEKQAAPKAKASEGDSNKVSASEFEAVAPETKVTANDNSPAANETTPEAAPKITDSGFESVSETKATTLSNSPVAKAAKEYIDPQSLEGRRIASEKIAKEKAAKDEADAKAIASEKEAAQRKEAEKFVEKSTPMLKKIKNLSDESSRKQMLELLDLDPTKPYTKKEIVSAYRKASTIWHPDKWSQATDEIRNEATEIFKKINDAYESLVAKQNKYEIANKISEKLNLIFKQKNLNSFSEEKILNLKNLSCELLGLDPNEPYSTTKTEDAVSKLQYGLTDSDLDLKFEDDIKKASSFLKREYFQAKKDEAILKRVPFEPEQVKELSPSGISRLDDVQIRLLTKADQIKNLSKAQIDAFTDIQLSKKKDGDGFSDDKIKQLKKQFESLKPTAEETRLFEERINKARPPKK